MKISLNPRRADDFGENQHGGKKTERHPAQSHEEKPGNKKRSRALRLLKSLHLAQGDYSIFSNE